MTDPMLGSAAYVLKDSLGELRQAVEGLPDEALNWKPAGDDTNSVAVLVTHVLHSTRSWVSAAVAAPLPDRDRASEFRVSADKTGDLLALMDNFGGQILALLNDSSDIDWAANRKTHMRPDPSLPDYVPASFALLHAIEHFGQHVAHVNLTRQLWDSRNH
jgi:DinB superfamily